MIHYFFIFLFSLLSILVHGYQFAVTDQAIFIPYIHKIRDPSLFPGDILFEQSSANTSFFYYIVAQLTKIIDIEPLFFAAYLIFQVIFFFGIYSLSKILTNNKYLAYLGILPFLIPKFIAGTSIYTFDTFFGYRSIGLVIFIFYLTLIIQNKFYKASIIAAIGILFHALSIIPTLALLPAVIIFNSQKKFKTLLLTSLIIISISSLLIINSDFDTSKLKEHVFDSLWYSTILFRDQYLFPSQWKPIEWAALIFYLGTIFLFIKKINPETRKNILVIAATCVLIFVINYTFLDLIKTPIIAQFQLVRSIMPLAYLSLLLTPLFLMQKNKLLATLGFLVFFSISLNIYWLLVPSFALYFMLFFLTTQKLSAKLSPRIAVLVVFLIFIIYLINNFDSYKNLSQKFQIPKPENPWIDVQKWAKTNTDVSEKFVVLPRQIGFRIYSQRSIVADLKDGAVVMYDPQYAKKWYLAQKDFENFYTLGESDLRLLKEKYNFNYIVTIGEHFLNFDVAYKNSYYVVYKL